MNRHLRTRFNWLWLTTPLLALTLVTACGNASHQTPQASAAIAQSPASAVTAATPPTDDVAATQPPAAATRTPPTPTATPEPTATPQPTVPPAPVIAEPVRLRIPKIELDSAMQQVGLDDSGAMGVPSNYTDVAWYRAGARPGNPGNAVIDGHLDSKTGPAVFYRLGELQPGDEVFITTADGAELRFVVTGLETYPADQPPLFSVFGPVTDPHLNLITCDGTFNHDVHQYDERLLVRTVLAPP